MSVLLRLLLSTLLINAVTAHAAVELDGPVVQGGLLTGKTEPGSGVTVDGIPVRVSSEGVFLVGFGRDHDADTRLVVEAPNGVKESRTLKVEPRDYEIQRIDGLPPSKVTPSEADLKRIREDIRLVKAARDRDDARSDFLSGWQWPVTGIITGVYGSQRILNGEPRRPHFGVDIAAPVGTLIQAPADGIVTLAHNDMFYSGGTLIIDHGHHLNSSFLHLHKILVKEGDVVHSGDPIAEVGSTGRVTGPHLDWRMNLGGARIDPQLLVPPMPKQASAK